MTISSETAPVTIRVEQSSIFPAGKRVLIIMATYNGARFVEEQVRSIQNQTYQDWILLVRDDGSSDGTRQQIASLAQQDRRIRLLADDLGNQGVIGNFAVLMETALEMGTDYLFFADQDDVWLPEKLSVMLFAMEALECAHGEGVPLLIHCDLAVVDEQLRCIAASFMKYSSLSPARADLGVLLGQNQVTGCACMINRKLLELSCPVPREVLMHDWWLALLAAAGGKIGYVPMPLVKYRQHAGNVLGAGTFWQRLWQLLRSWRQWEQHIKTIKSGIWQSRLLAERLREKEVALPAGAIEQIETYARILEIRPASRASMLRRHGIGKSVLRTGWVFAILIALMRNDAGSKRVA